MVTFFRVPRAGCPMADQVAAPTQESSSDGSSEFPSEHASTAEWGAVFALIGPGGNTSSVSYNASDWAEVPVLYNSSDPSSGSSNSSTVGDEKNSLSYLVKKRLHCSLKKTLFGLVYLLQVRADFIHALVEPGWPQLFGVRRGRTAVKTRALWLVGYGMHARCVVSHVPCL